MAGLSDEGGLSLILCLDRLHRWTGDFEFHPVQYSGAALIVSNVALILSNRTLTRGVWRAANPALWWVVGGALAGLLLVIYIPAANAMFFFSTLDGAQLLMAFAAGASCILWYELLKNLNLPSFTRIKPV